MDDDYMYDVDLDAAYEKTVGPSEMPMTMYKGNEKSIGSYVKQLKNYERSCQTQTWYDFFSQFRTNHMIFYRKKETDTAFCMESWYGALPSSMKDVHNTYPRLASQDDLADFKKFHECHRGCLEKALELQARELNFLMQSKEEFDTKYGN